jgi:hypothetical protein
MEKPIIYIIALLFIVFLIYFFTYNKTSPEKMNNGSSKKYAGIVDEPALKRYYIDNTEKYIPEYYRVFNKFPYWYSDKTPLVWANPTRLFTGHKSLYPLYAYY